MTEQAILKQAKLPRNPRERMYAYWLRTIGWDSLSAVPNLVKFRQAVESKIPRTDPEMLTAIERSQSPEYQVAKAACGDLRKYERDADAFAALAKIVTTHKDRRVRLAAMGSLWAFRDFDLAPVCAHVVKHDDDSMITSALRLAGEQDLSNVVALHEQATHHTSASIRRQAVDSAGRYKLAAMEKTLLRLYRYDQDKNIKRSALRSLAMMRIDSILPVLQRLIRSQDRNEKFEALDAFTAWGDDPKVLDILDPYKSDPVIGSRVTSHLYRHGR